MNKLILVLSVFFLGFSNPFRPVHIFMIGDSTMANKAEEAIPEYGWGQVLHYFFNDSIAVDNLALNGHSSKSFMDEGIWEKIISKVQKGDYLVAVKQVALEEEVYFIDLEAKTRKLVTEMGKERSKQLFLHFESGVYPLRPDGLSDNSHVSQQGAFTVSGLAVKGMKELGIPVLRYLVNK